MVFHGGKCLRKHCLLQQGYPLHRLHQSTNHVLQIKRILRFDATLSRIHQNYSVPAQSMEVVINPASSPMQKTTS